MLSTMYRSAAIALAVSSLPGAYAVFAAKRGLAWPSDNTFDPKVFATASGGAVDYIYNWGTTPGADFSAIPSYYVMQWNGAGIANLAAEIKAAGSNVVMGFNEPSNLTPAAAAALWIQYIQPLRTSIPGIKLISPAVTNAGAPSGIAWMDSFIAACTGCTFDGIGYLDNTPQIAQYAFFGAFYDGTAKDMLTSTGALTTVGNLYATYNAQGCNVTATTGGTTTSIASTSATSTTTSSAAGSTSTAGATYVGGGTLDATDSDCNGPCAGDSTTKCGGSYRLSVYKSGGATTTPATSTTSTTTKASTSSTTTKTTTAPASTGTSYVGCYTDSGSPRTLNGTSTTSSAMTNALCESTCYAAGYVYAGTAGTLDTTDSDCNGPCAGDSTTKCGGTYRLSVYKIR
ncbi:hypothetical protein FRB97_007891 [Tulasnella sp. 331]|nr:hypothetical protein FRB97_007891 [Tulasnella sp. 331]KAG8876834.1 hypothetical protein FRB98_007009 [Tulasnella sp. 332]